GCNAIANYVTGYVGSNVGELGAMAIFSGIAVSATVSGVILLLFSNTLVRWMHGAENTHSTAEQVEEQQVQVA
ncbi:dipeptide/tripeptide permease, partial [Vibrio parahaemolyticus]|nr:dipeptide/tripeptide permease [Vibrio parahaemolyticus]